MIEPIEIIKYILYFIILLMPFYILIRLHVKYYKKYINIKSSEICKKHDMDSNFKKAKFYYHLLYVYVFFVFLAFAIYIISTSESFHEEFLK